MRTADFPLPDPASGCQLITTSDVSPAARRIGLDLDNTIIDYRAVFRQAAVAMGFCAPDFAGGKTALRAHIRARPHGEHAWMRLQAQVYGPALPDATAAPGALAFVRRCVTLGIPTYIVSHKTRFAAAGSDAFDLRAAALRWLIAHGFVGTNALPPRAVFFEATRAAKLARIAALGCTSFVDDLHEIFDDPGFPGDVERLLLGDGPEVTGSCHVMPDWRAVMCHMFGPG